MDKLFNWFYELMKYVDLFVSPMWNYFKAMSGFKLFISAIIFIAVAFALYTITETCSLEYNDSIIARVIPMAEGYVWIARLLFLPMVAFLGMVFVFEGTGIESVFQVFIRTDTPITLSNMAEWDMPFATIILAVVVFRCIAGFLYCILTLDILEMARFVASILAALLSGMWIGRIFMMLFTSHNRLLFYGGNILGIVVACGAALVFALGLTAWIRDLFSPVLHFLARIFSAFDGGELVLVDRFGNEYSPKNTSLLYLMFLLSDWKI